MNMPEGWKRLWESLPVYEQEEISRVNTAMALNLMKEMAEALEFSLKLHIERLKILEERKPRFRSKNLRSGNDRPRTILYECEKTPR
jgi:hypothetical protein